MRCEREVKELAQNTLDAAMDKGIEMRDLLMAMAGVAAVSVSFGEEWSHPSDYTAAEVNWLKDADRYLKLATQFDSAAWPPGVRVRISIGTPENHQTTLWHGSLAAAARVALRAAKEMA